MAAHELGHAIQQSYHIKIYRGIMARGIMSPNEVNHITSRFIGELWHPRKQQITNSDHITSRFIGELWHAKDDK